MMSPSLQYGIVVRYAMHYHVVDRSADTGRKRRAIWIGESLEGWLGPIVTDELFGNFVKPGSGNAGLYVASQFAKRPAHEQVRLAHKLYFILSLQKYVHR